MKFEYENLLFSILLNGFTEYIKFAVSLDLWSEQLLYY